jgi:SAM-dependent methyltransferase
MKTLFKALRRPASAAERMNWKKNKFVRLRFKGGQDTDSLPLRWSDLPSRSSFLNQCLERYAYSSYLEIGCDQNDNFNAIDCDNKTGVDPKSGGTIRSTSDEFFAVNQQSFDLIFIDGLHHSGQVQADVKNALACLKPNGTIVLHDCLPVSEAQQAVPREQLVWNGDCWKAVTWLRTLPEIDVAVGKFDHGVGVVKPRRNTAPLSLEVSEQHVSNLRWRDFHANYQEWLRVMEYDDLLDWIK